LRLAQEASAAREEELARARARVDELSHALHACRLQGLNSRVDVHDWKRRQSVLARQLAQAELERERCVQECAEAQERVNEARFEVQAKRRDAERMNRLEQDLRSARRRERSEREERSIEEVTSCGLVR